MKISYKWLQEYFDEKLPEPKKLEELMVLKSFEVEEISELNDDFIYDIDILPNRAHDCLSYEGVAFEVSAITGLKLKKDSLYTNPEKKINFDNNFDSNIKLQVENLEIGEAFSQENFIAPHKQFCNRYLGCVIENIAIGPSPLELKNKLESIGEKSINNLVDITNIVMFSLGQPMHAFDKDKISGEKVVIRRALADEILVTLDNKNLKLNENHFVIADEKDALALAGVKGGKKAEVDINTKNIILESANFNSTAVRKVSRGLNILTESSKRFENEITPWLADRAMLYAIDLIKKYASNENTKIYKVIEYYPKKSNDYITGFSVSGINKILGTKYTQDEMLNALDKLKFEYEFIENPRNKILEEANKLIGKAYKYGSSISFDAPDCFDCSTFVSYVYSRAGLSIPRITIDQLIFGNEISESEVKPGDLIFGNSHDGMIRTETVNFLPGTRFEKGCDHVGVYIGQGKVMHASRYNLTKAVEVTDISSHVDFKEVVSYRSYFKDEESRIAVKIPRTRIDIKNETDLAEEIGRILGYENVSDQEILMNDFSPKIHIGHYINQKIRKILVDLGFSEVITYSFVYEGEIAPQNPIANDKAFLRNSLKIGINDSLIKNVQNADWLLLDRIKIFEIGKVFTKQGEKMMLGIGVKNKNGIKKPKPFEIINEALSELEKSLKIEISKITDQSQEFIEIDLTSLEEKVQILGDYEKLDTTQVENFKTISVYPFMTRDIAVWINDNDDAQKLIEIIKKESGNLLIKEPKLFDKFSKDGKTSYAYRMVYQSYEKTLTDEEVNSVMNKIYEQIQVLGWEVR